MIILIPLGGTGDRFKNNGYKLPKALIKVDNKPILFHLLDNINIQNTIDFVYIPYNKEYEEYNFENLLNERYPSIKFKFLVLENNTRGAADTIRIALTNINTNDCPILCLDSDNFYTIDIIQLWNGENKVFTFQDKLNDPIYSYVTNIPSTDIINTIIEKEKISDNACCGAYGFKSWWQLLYYTNYIIEHNLIQKNEYYTSSVIKEMINQKIEFKNNTIQNKFYYSLGTPKQVTEYEYSFLFDLDGTLVNTDHIYTEAWDIIFKKYNFGFVVDKTFFDNFIKGKNDGFFLNYLLPNISKETVNEISNLKDDLFIELLKNTRDPILLPGVLKFFELNKNRRIAIVTSCNKKSAEYIIEHTGLNNYISLLITASDCIKHKPDPEPYLKAIDKLMLDKEKTIIFEDSYSGYTSAKNAQVYKIILVCSESSCKDIINANEYKIVDYTKFKIDDILKETEKEKIDDVLMDDNKICNIIKKEILKSHPIKDIIRNDIQLKTGYICDIQSYKIIFNDNSNENIVFKINNTENELSKTAEKMNLYGNEINFYKNIRDSINSDIIHVPKCYGVVEIDKDGVRKGIILENLFKYDGHFNIDLNKDTRNLLNVVSEISKLHIKYYFKTFSEVPLNMQRITTMDDLIFFKQLLLERFETFVKKNKLVLKVEDVEIMHKCFQNYEKNVIQTSRFPLSFCHGDFKSANIFYRNIDNNKNNTPYFLDWQYINLNKGVSDIVFLLVESIEFDTLKVNLVVNYYYSLISEKIKGYTYEEYMSDFKTNLCIFPFVVCVWFNSEDNDKLLDKIFPIKFMKNLMKYYNYFNIE
jgi:HAD superfamily hydrolase (TIGR01509 family)